jgi:hypothetical protein
MAELFKRTWSHQRPGGDKKGTESPSGWRAIYKVEKPEPGEPGAPAGGWGNHR